MLWGGWSGSIEIRVSPPAERASVGLVVVAWEFCIFGLGSAKIILPAQQANNIKVYLIEKNSVMYF